FKQWALRFGPESRGQRNARVWNDLSSEVRRCAREASISWLQRSMVSGAPAPVEKVANLLRPASAKLTPASPLNRVQVLNWFRHDAMMWACLEELATSPANGYPRARLARLAREIEIGQPRVMLDEEREIPVDGRSL